LRSTASATGVLTSVTLAEQDNQTITAADTTYFVVFTYGTPCTITTSETAPNGYNAIPLGKVMKDGSDNVHYIDGGFRFGDGVRKLHQRAKTLRALELESGSAIEYSGTNNFIMGTGIVYGGLNAFFTYVYDDGAGGWTETGSNVIDFAHYDDGDGTLGNVGVARYGVHYVYRHVDDGDVYVVYGTGSYTLAEAEIAAIIPPTIPNHLTDFGCLIGAIIAPQAGGSFTAVIMVTSQFFSGTEVANHNNLGGLQGGTAGEEYHLTAAQHTITTQPADTDNSGYLLTADWDTFNNKIANIKDDTTPELGEQLQSGAHSINFTEQILTSGTAIAWNLGNSNKAILTAAHNFTITITAPTGALNAQLIITQDGTGTRVMDEIVTQKDEAIATTDVHTDTEIIDLTIDIPTGARIRFKTSDADLPDPLVIDTIYYAIRTSENHIKVATTKANAIAGTNIDITDTGTGTHTVQQLVKWTDGTLGVLSTAAGSEDIVSLTYKTADKQWYAQLSKDFS